MLNNKWRHGKTPWASVEPFPWTNLPGFSSGIMPMPVILDPDVGREVALYIIDYTSFARKIAALKPFQLYLKCGLVRCDAGPVFFLLFWLPHPRSRWLPTLRLRNEPFAAFEYFVNPHEPSMVEPLRDLASQTHWHVFVIGPDDETLNFLELPNNYGLETVLPDVDRAVSTFPMVNFDAAKAELQARYSLADLFTLEE